MFIAASSIKKAAAAAAGLTAVAAAAGFGLFEYTCARRKTPDYWDEAVLDRRGNAALKRGILAGKAWLADRPAEEVSITNRDGLRLRALFVPEENPRGTVLFFHGYHSSWKMDFSCVLRFVCEQGFQLLLVDERAHGASEGRFLTYGVRERFDVQDWVDYAAERFGADHPLILDGLSMGASVVLMASDLPFRGNVRGIIADCGFTSPHEILGYVFHARTRLPAGPALALLAPWARAAAGFGLRECSTTGALAHTTLPVLLIHGTADRFVPCRMSKEAYLACAGEKELLLIDGAAHGMSYITDTPRVQAAVTAFLDRHCPRAAYTAT